MVKTAARRLTSANVMAMTAAELTALMLEHCELMAAEKSLLDKWWTEASSQISQAVAAGDTKSALVVSRYVVQMQIACNGSGFDNPIWEPFEKRATELLSETRQESLRPNEVVGRIFQDGRG